MRIAFYAPLKSPADPTPSGDRNFARALMKALERAGATVDLPSTLRTFDGAGDAGHQKTLREEGETEVQRLVSLYRSGKRPRPDIWLTYHLYYKAPDWLGAPVSGALNIPYVIVEPSIAPKRAGGPWDIGYRGVEAALRAASRCVTLKTHDEPALRRFFGDGQKLVHLPLFIDETTLPEPSRSGADGGDSLTGEGTPPADSQRANERPVELLTVAMMRRGPKWQSYQRLAEILRDLEDLPWRLTIVGAGEMEPEVRRLFGPFPENRISFAGALEGPALAKAYAAADVFVWPAVHEAAGLVFLEAAAHGLAVVAQAVRGVPEVVIDTETGLLAPADDWEAFRAHLRRLIADPALRSRLGAEGARWIRAERTIDAAAIRLRNILEALS